MKMAILGTGMIVKGLMKTIQKLNLEKVILMGMKETEEETRMMCEENHLDGYALDYESILNSDVDTVYIALPNHLHASFAKKALEANKHIILEKPITANLKQLKELIEIAENHHKMIFEAMNVHYMPAFLKLQESLKKAGEIKIISLNYSQYSSRYDAFKQGNVLAAFDPLKAGGALMDLNVYNLHSIVGLFGKPQSVHYLANIERKIDVSGILTMDYGNFKASAIAAKDCKAPVRCTIQGNEGCFVISKPMNQIDSFEFVDHDGKIESFVIEEPQHRLYYEFIEFEKMIREEDWKRQKQMLEISLTVSEILEEARKQNHLYLDFE